MTEQEWLNNNQLSLDIWSKKYRFEDESFDQWLDRVSGGNQDIRQLIKDKKFLFGGRILANRGLEKLGKRVTLSNCYVIAPPEDNIESIFTCASQLARTYSYGGGCGVDVSKLRPKNALVNNAAKTTSGCTSFMDFFSYVTGLIGQSGRRGALLLSMDCTHPDLEEFINLKSDLDICTKANISVRVNDAFMKAVEGDLDWKLSFTTEHETIEKTVKAKDILMLLAKRNWEMAEPGILFWDNINDNNLMSEDPNFSYAGLNPCAEEPLPAYGSCLLGSINLSEFVINPFTQDAKFDYNELNTAVEKSVIALNEVLMEGLPLHPLKEQQESVGKWRQIGLGTFGLGDMFIKLGIKYGSPKSISLINDIFKNIAQVAVLTSLKLAKEKGMFPICNPKAIAHNPFINRLHLPDEVIKEIEKYGLYNSQLLTCAPTGSTATMLEVSTGVEPNFAFSFNRRTVSLNNEETTYKVDTKIVSDYRKVTNDNNEDLPDYFVSAHTVNPISRVYVQSALQTWIDASISSTINLPESASIKDIYDLYIEAWRYGLKGLTIWRDNCQRQGILTTSESKEESTDEIILDSLSTISRDDIGKVLSGETYKYKTACGTLYVTVNKDSDGNIVEVFTNSSKNGTCKANLNGETRLLSLALRTGIRVEEVIDALKSIQCQSCIYSRAKGNKIDGSSCPDIIAKAIRQSYNKLDKPTTTSTSVCPECGGELNHSGGCVQCPSCGYSKCN